MKLLRDFRIVIDEREALRYQGYKKYLPLKDDIAKILTSELPPSKLGGILRFLEHV